jgi:oligosaccharyl transferase complex subunit OST4
MISDSGLYTLAIFLGSAAMLMIVLYHFLEVNALDDDVADSLKSEKIGVGATRPIES